MQTDRKNCIFSGNHSGFTLIEVLIAMTIFSIGILAVAGMQSWNTKNNTTGNITTQAAMLARAKMEELKSAADVSALVSGSEINLDPQGQPGGIFARSWTVSNPLGGDSTRQVQVTVSWSRRGRNRSIELTTITLGNGI